MNMNEIEELQNDIFNAITEAKDERQALLDKINEGEALTRKEAKRNKYLVTIIKKYEILLQRIQELKDNEEALNALKVLGNTELDFEARENAYNYLINNYQLLLNGDLEELLSLVDWEDDETKDLSTLKAKIAEDIKELETEYKMAKRNRFNKYTEEEIANIKFELESRKEDLEKINNFATQESIKEDLDTLLSLGIKEEERKPIVEKYNTILSDKEDDLVEEIDQLNEEIAALEKSNPKKKIKKQPEDEENEKHDDPFTEDEELEYEEEEEEKEKVSVFTKIKTFCKKHTKALRNTAIGIAAVAVIAAASYGISKLIDRDNNNDNDNDLGYEDLDQQDPNLVETVYGTVSREQLEALINKGYTEYASIMMLLNFDQDTIATILKAPYLPEIENYVTVKEFKFDYLKDYEDARNKYNHPSENIVDYVNRSYEINNLNFFDEATIADTVEVVEAIDSQELMTVGNNDVANSLNNSFNSVLNNSLYGTVTEQDLVKVTTMPLFAKEGTDLHRFLTTYSTLAEEAIRTNSEEARNKMFTFLSIFTYNLFNNNHSESIPFTDDEEFNEAATVTNLYDWWIAKNSFVTPLYSTYCPYDFEDERFTRWWDLEGVMLSAEEDPQFSYLCGPQRNLEKGD